MVKSCNQLLLLHIVCVSHTIVVLCSPNKIDLSLGVLPSCSLYAPFMLPSTWSFLCCEFRRVKRSTPGRLIQASKYVQVLPALIGWFRSGESKDSLIKSWKHQDLSKILIYIYWSLLKTVLYIIVEKIKVKQCMYAQTQNQHFHRGPEKKQPWHESHVSAAQLNGCCVKMGITTTLQHEPHGGKPKVGKGPSVFLMKMGIAR